MKEKKQTKWIGHFLRKDTSEIQRVALRCIPPGKRNRGRQKKTWWTSVDKEMIDQGWIRAYNSRCKQKGRSGDSQ